MNDNEINIKKDFRHTIIWLVIVAIDLILTIAEFFNLKNILGVDIPLINILIIVFESYYIIMLLYHKAKRLSVLNKLKNTKDEITKNNYMKFLERYAKLGSIKLVGSISIYVFLSFLLSLFTVLNGIVLWGGANPAALFFAIVFLIVLIILIITTIRKAKDYKSMYKQKSKLKKAA